MTEQEWLELDAPRYMLTRSGMKISGRKMRLFAVACCRQIWDLLTHPISRSAVEIAERFADGNATIEELNKIRRSHRHCKAFRTARNAAEVVTAATSIANTGYIMTLTGEDERDDLRAISWAMMASEKAIMAISHPDFDPWRPSGEPNWPQWSAARLAQVAIGRDIFGNPFRPVELDPNWLTSTVIDLARVIYGECAFDQMPILSDALMDAGCDNEEILSHCKQQGQHIRGCWVVDLLLGKE